MYVVPVRVKHSDSDKEVKNFALLDSCSQGTFVTEDLISKLSVSGVKTSINIKALNGNQKQSSSLVQGLMVSAPITSPSNQIIYKARDNSRSCGNGNTNQVEEMKIS